MIRGSYSPELEVISAEWALVERNRARERGERLDAIEAVLERISARLDLVAGELVRVAALVER